jgi:hypothetical protein
MKKPVLLIASFLLLCGVLAAEEPLTFSKGPLIGKSMYIPYLLHYSFPSLSARSGKKGSFQYHLSMYYINDCEYYKPDPTPPKGTRIYDTDDISRDYESCVGELGFGYNWRDNLQLGIDFRVISYYGGFLDQVVNGVHSIGFPDGGRSYFKMNRLHIDIPNSRGPDLKLDKNSVSFGDIDLWAKDTFFENQKVSLAWIAAFKIPSGQFSRLSGSGWPDMGGEFAADFRPWYFMTFYTQAGLVIPWDLQEYYPMFNGMLGLEVNPWKHVSLNVQINIKTTSLTNNIRWSWNDKIHAYSLPQMDLLFGPIFAFGNCRWQIYFEEDAFTNQGPDITFNMRFSQSF